MKTQVTPLTLVLATLMLASTLRASPDDAKVLIEPVENDCPEFIGFPAVASDGRVVLADSFINDAGNAYSSLIFTRRPSSLKQKQRKIKRIPICEHEVEGVRVPSLKLSNKVLKQSQKDISAFKPMSQEISFTFDEKTTALVVNAGHRKYKTTLPKHRVPLYCCDAESQRGTCLVSPNKVRAFIAPYEGVVVVEHRVTHQADGCSFGPQFKVLRVRKRSKDPSMR